MPKNWLLLIAAPLALASCANPQESVVEEFFTAVEDADYNRAIDNLSPDFVNMIGREKLQTLLARQNQGIAQCGGIDAIKTDVKGDEFVQTGTVSISFKGACPARVETVKLVKVQNEWKIGADK